MDEIEFDPRGFGRRLRAAMVIAGLSTNELAAQMHTGQMTVQRHMRGDTLPDLRQTDRYCRILGCTPSYLLWASRDSNPQPTDCAA